jgi:hypothetical protein
MENKTINEWMVIKKVLMERKADLKNIRIQTAVKRTTTQRYGDNATEELTEPQYDTKLLDRRITEIQNADLAIDAAIKQSNAMIFLGVNVDVEKLLSPME